MTERIRHVGPLQRAVRAAGDELGRETVERLCRGDPRAFETIFHAYYSELAGFAYRYVRARDAAEEIVHNVLARLWERRERFDVRDQLRSYLYTAVRNEALNHIRHELVERRMRERLLQSHRANAAAHRPAGPDAKLESDELAVAFARALEGLSERCRLAFMLRVQRQMSNAEVAAAIGVSIKTVEAYMTRAIAALRESGPSLLPHL